jgi:hypothetical protein
MEVAAPATLALPSAASVHFNMHTGSHQDVLQTSSLAAAFTAKATSPLQQEVAKMSSVVMEVMAIAEKDAVDGQKLASVSANVAGGGGLISGAAGGGRGNGDGGGGGRSASTVALGIGLYFTFQGVSKVFINKIKIRTLLQILVPCNSTRIVVPISCGSTATRNAG